MKFVYVNQVYAKVVIRYGQQITAMVKSIIQINFSSVTSFTVCSEESIKTFASKFFAGVSCLTCTTVKTRVTPAGVLKWQILLSIIIKKWVFSRFKGHPQKLAILSEYLHLQCVRFIIDTPLLITRALVATAIVPFVYANVFLLCLFYFDLFCLSDFCCLTWRMKIAHVVALTSF